MLPKLAHSDPQFKAKKVRAGRYKKVLANGAQLQDEAQELYGRLSPLFTLGMQKHLSDAEVAGVYILTYLQFRRPRDWLSSSLSKPLSFIKNPDAFNLYDLPHAQELFRESIRSRLGKHPTVHDLFSRFSVRAVPLAVNHALLKWLDGAYDLTLTHQVPSPEEILMMQAEGRRCVTVISGRDEMSQLVLNQRDPLGFTLHDLLHADRFFVQPELVAGQIGFSRLMCKALKAKTFESLLASDASFRHEFEYVIGDMNSYCVHMVKCLKAVCLGAFLRRENKPANGQLSELGLKHYEDFFAQLNEIWQAPIEVRAALQCLNTKLENVDCNHNHIIQTFFDNHGAKNAQGSVASS